MSRRSKRLPAYARRHESGIVSDLECAAIICADISQLEAEMRKLTCLEQHVGMRADVSGVSGSWLCHLRTDRDDRGPRLDQWMDDALKGNSIYFGVS
jgi:hypothetical protein